MGSGTIQQYPFPEICARFQFPTQVSDLFRDGTQRALPQSLFHLAFGHCLSFSCSAFWNDNETVQDNAITTRIIHYQWRSKPQQENPSGLAVVCVWPNIWSLDAAQLHKQHRNLASVPCQLALWDNNPISYLNNFNRNWEKCATWQAGTATWHVGLRMMQSSWFTRLPSNKRMNTIEYVWIPSIPRWPKEKPGQNIWLA